MNKRTLRIIPIIVCLIAVFVFFTVFEKPTKKLRVSFFDVGQGDAIFIETPSGRQILIDGGPDRIVLSRLGEMMSFWDRSIDMIIMTHSDADHLTGLLDVIERYQIGTITVGNHVSESELLREWSRRVREKNIPIHLLQSGQILEVEEGITLEWLTPIIGFSSQENNEYSLVTRLSYGDADFLFTGDITERVEYELMQHFCGSRTMCPELQSEVLKVAHHGSKTSTSGEWLQMIKPEYAVIQVGKKNTFGHPHPAILKRLETAGTKVFRTDQEGTIIFETDGHDILVTYDR